MCSCQEGYTGDGTVCNGKFIIQFWWWKTELSVGLNEYSNLLKKFFT